MRKRYQELQPEDESAFSETAPAKRRNAPRGAVQTGLAAVALALGSSSLSTAAPVRDVPRPPATVYTYDGHIYDRLFSSLALKVPQRSEVQAKPAAPTSSAPAYSVTDLGIDTSLELAGVSMRVLRAWQQQPRVAAPR